MKRALLALILPVFISCAQAPAPAGQVSPSNEASESPMPVTEEDLKQALEDEAQEDARIEAATADFAVLLETSPTEPRDFIVSFEEPESLRLLLEKSDVDLTTVYTWLHAERSLFPKVGEWHLLPLEAKNESPEGIASRIQSQTMSYLEERAEALVAQPSDQVSDEALKAQLGELEVLAATIEHEGLAIYGYRCTCSPLQVEEVSADLQLSARVVELAGAVDEPVWPVVPARDAILEAAGMERA